MNKLIELMTGENAATISAIVVVAVLFLNIIMFKRRYKKAGPNELMIISGQKRKIRLKGGSEKTIGFRWAHGAGTFVWPVIERVDILPLDLMTLEIKISDAATRDGAVAIVNGIAQVKISSEDESIIKAAERFLGKSRDEVRRIALQSLEGHLRSALAVRTTEEISSDREKLVRNVREAAAGDMDGMGMKMDSFTIHNIKSAESA